MPRRLEQWTVKGGPARAVLFHDRRGARQRLYFFCRRSLQSPAMEDAIRTKLTPGAKVKVTQQIAGRDYTWTSDVAGTVVSYEQKQTGSWFAHSKNDKLWLDRLVLRKDDGELTTLILDDYSRVEVKSPGEK
jgi:hypothetical protein